MKYRKDKYGKDISQLGFGCMRFPKKGNSIDYNETEKLLMYAIENGINYFDTAYIYGGSEECLGKLLAKNNVREKINIATKLPQFIMKSMSQIEKTFSEELTRLQTNYIDYYLMHMFTDYEEWEHLKSIGIENFINKHKEDGSIRNIGFSYHGDTDMFLKILNAYDWDFCQIQYNYLDEISQAGRKGLEAAYEKGIPVIIMEPLRGGKLVQLPDKAKSLLNKSSKKYTPAQLSFSWLLDQPGVTCILSGMNTMDMVVENIKTASEVSTGNFTEEDFALVEEVKKIIKEREKVGCTGCRYCMPCPKGVDIPGNFYYYNLTGIDKLKSVRFEFARNMGMRKDAGFASQCVNCGKCEKHCPQNINIREKLKEADAVLRPWHYKFALSVIRKFMSKKTTK